MDCSYKRDKTLTRLIRTEGFGCAVREGAEVVVRFSVHAPGPGGRHGPAEILLYDSDHGFPHGLCMAHGRTLHAEALGATAQAVWRFLFAYTGSLPAALLPPS